MTVSTLDVDRNISTLRLNSQAFSKIENILLSDMFDECIQNIKSIAYFWATIGADNKGIKGTVAEGEEWLGGPFASTIALQYYIDFLRNNTVITEDLINDNKIHIFPNKPIEKLLFPFITADMHFSKNMSKSDIINSRGFGTRLGFKNGISLILGAGNVSSIPLLDTIYDMVVNRHCILLKLNPVNEYLKPVFEKVFENFISRGFMVVTTGDINVSSYMTAHSGITNMHLTGSDKTYENIVYGSTLNEKDKGKKTLSKKNKKPFTTELGNVTPFIIHPGKWSTSEIKYQARKIVTAKLNNNGFNCIAAQVIVLPKNWKQSQQLVEAIKKQLATEKDRLAYYPNSTETLKRLKSNKTIFQENDLTCATPHLTKDLDLNDYYEKNEVWSSTLFFKYLEHDNDLDYVNKAISYVNQDVWGNLGVAVLIKKHDSKKVKDITKNYVDNLKYGTIAINEWPALGFIIPTMPWGGYPGNKDSDIQSGQGYVHNAYFFESPLKGVLYSKFKLPIVDPVWFTSNKKGSKVFKYLTYYQIENSKINLIKLIFSALI
jgi:aldehyde dehydrogenase (NAD(P)+)